VTRIKNVKNVFYIYVVVVVTATLRIADADSLFSAVLYFFLFFPPLISKMRWRSNTKVYHMTLPVWDFTRFDGKRLAPLTSTRWAKIVGPIFGRVVEYITLHLLNAGTVCTPIVSVELQK